LNINQSPCFIITSQFRRRAICEAVKHRFQRIMLREKYPTEIK